MAWPYSCRAGAQNIRSLRHTPVGIAGRPLGDARRRAVRIVGGIPRCAPKLLDRIERFLDLEKCPTFECDGIVFRAVRRPVSTYYTATIQCQTCGHAGIGSLTKSEFFDFAALPLWDDALLDGWNGSRDARASARAAAWDSRLDAMRDDYREWLRTSPEWHSLRAKVLRRANYVCEGCLEAEARDVHHETYAMGRLPPAMFLHALCRTCHNRMHGK